jgi:hypothetical protein
MTVNPKPIAAVPQPSQTEVLGSLKDAADAAHSAFLAAAASNSTRAKALWVDSITVTNAYLAALNQALQGDPADIQAAKTALDAATQDINNKLSTLTNVTAAANLISKLLGLVTSVAKFFV